MDKAVTEVISQYEARALDEQQEFAAIGPAEMMQRLDEFLLHVGPETGNFLHSLAIARGAKRIVELGTSYGYSTIYLADAARATGGRVITYELHAEKQRYAREQIARAGLSELVDWRQGDAVTLLDQECDGIDFVLIDLWKDLYVPCFETLLPKLSPNAIIVADNMLYPESAREDARVYRRSVRALGMFETMLLPIGSGIELSCLSADDSNNI